MRVLMFGWEFPPHVSGGLGIACEGLVRGLVELDTEVTLVLPRRGSAPASPNLRIVMPSPAAEPPPPAARPRRIRLRRIASRLRPYTAELLGEDFPTDETDASPASTRGLYGPDLSREVLAYASAAGAIAAREPCDVIHAHDWMTFLAGIEARRASGKPLVLHVHATEFDRAGGRGSGLVTEIERMGLAAADRVVAVSRYTADVLAREYRVEPERLRIVHNAIDPRGVPDRWTVEEGEPLVLFAGRITRQKGPEYFVEAAARVAAERPDVKFVMAGSGDRRSAMIARVAAAGLLPRFLFTGFLPPADLDRLYARADVFVMPSASEPFGLAALEALQHGTPVIVSKSAGVSEVIRDLLRVEFGDVDDLASKILSVLAFEPLRKALSERGRAEVNRLTWREAAAQCIAVYRELVAESEPAD